MFALPGWYRGYTLRNKSKKVRPHFWVSPILISHLARPHLVLKTPVFLVLTSGRTPGHGVLSSVTEISDLELKVQSHVLGIPPLEAWGMQLELPKLPVPISIQEIIALSWCSGTCAHPALILFNGNIRVLTGKYSRNYSSLALSQAAGAWAGSCLEIQVLPGMLAPLLW